MIPFRDNVPARRYPLITVTIIAANLAVFFYELTLSPSHLEGFVQLYGVIPARLQSIHSHPLETLGGITTSIFTSMFLHAGWLHLLGNLWYLWIFGDNVEDRMGHFRFLVFYLLCGLAAGLLHVGFNASSVVPSVGASGAIAGVLGAYLVSYPMARILTLIPFFFFWPIVELPALLVLGAWFLIQLLSGTAAIATASSTTGGVAWWAHIGGFLAGIVLIGRMARYPVPRQYWRR